ncbi:uncharacterized protein LOC111056391 isoform X1 [Nilaparvata lugens]|uniref:uncharacterized protein LOC111056391 isoform X1 n=1 Tax=Nilaparvata lugens TaxID=108931 RepID=UPI00193E5EE0|nr:uncharacterized protein LOC111056391 isoform X1 [Nilaparvata lugens]
MKPKNEYREHFYQTIRLLSIIMKSMGIFTLQNATAKNGNLLYHKTINLTILWFSLLQIINFNTMIQPPQRNAIFMAQASSHFLKSFIACAIIVLRTEKLFLKAIKDIESFDDEFLGDPAIGSERRGIMWLYKFVTLFSLHLFLSYMLGGLGFFVIWHCVINVTAKTSISVMFLIIQEELIHRYNYLTKFWNIRVEKAQGFSKEILIEKLRTSHGKLGIILQEVNNSCGLRVIILFFSSVFEILLFYHNPENMHDTLNNRRVKILQSLYYTSEFLLSFIVLTSAARLSTKTREILRCFRTASINGVLPYCKQQMIFLSTQVYVKQAKVTAGGFFDLNRSVAISMLLTGATYLLLCYQSRFEIANMLDAYGNFLNDFSIKKGKIIEMITPDL